MLAMTFFSILMILFLRSRKITRAIFETSLRFTFSYSEMESVSYFLCYCCEWIGWIIFVFPWKRHNRKRRQENWNCLSFERTSLVAQMIKHLSTMRETRVRALGWEDPLEKEMAIHSTTIAWKIPWTEEPGRLQSMGSQRVRHDWATSLHFGTPQHRRHNDRHTGHGMTSPFWDSFEDRAVFRALRTCWGEGP